MRPQLAHAVAASGPSSVWAFGLAVQRWTGTRWRVVGRPADRFIQSAVVESASDIWVAGNAPTGPGGHGVILRWDGHRWHTVLRAKRGGVLFGISRVPGTQRFWAVGYHVKDGHFTPMIRHRGARGWRPAANPPVENGQLNAVASSSNGTWAVGSTPAAAIAERWVGGRWVRTPVPDSAGVKLLGVAAVEGTGHAWAVGYRLTGSGHRPVVYRWSHGTWHSVPIDLGQREGELDGVISTNPGFAWAVGHRIGTSGLIEPLVEHWSRGPSWQAVLSPTPASNCSWTLHAITEVPQTTGPTLWAVGDGGCSFETISERYR